MNRRSFLFGLAGCTSAAAFRLSGARSVLGQQLYAPGFRLADVTSAAGIDFRHNAGAYGGKLLPETLGAGCAFLDYDGDGWQDILLVNGTDWPGHFRAPTTMRLYRNNRNGTFTDVTRQAGLNVPLYGMGVAVGDYNNDGHPDIFVSAVGQSRLFQNTGKGTFVDVTSTSRLGGRQAFSTSALWFDFDRDGLLDLFVCNYVRWSSDHDVFCSLDGKHKSYCTPEAYRGETCWLFHNRGDGTFEDVTPTSGIFDTSSKSLGVAMFDDDSDGWPDLFVTNDTQPNKLYRNRKNGTFEEMAVKEGVAFSSDGRTRAGMGVDVAEVDGSARQTIAVTNFDNEMIGLYQQTLNGYYEDVALKAGVGLPSINTLGFGCLFADLGLAGSLELIVANGHIDETVRNIRGNVGYAQPPLFFQNDGHGVFHDVSGLVGKDFGQPKVGRGLAYGDFDRDGDLDLLMTTNQGPAYLYRNDLFNANRSIRFRLIGTRSNRDAIGSQVRIESAGRVQQRMVRTGSSYLSQSELPVTFGLGQQDQVDRVVLQWPSGRTEEYKNLRAGRTYDCVEAKGIEPRAGF